MGKPNVAANQHNENVAPAPDVSLAGPRVFTSEERKALDLAATRCEVWAGAYEDGGSVDERNAAATIRKLLEKP